MKFFPRSIRPVGFTILELLVSMAVGMMAVALLATMISAASDLTSRVTRKDRTLTSSRAALDLLGYDLRGIIARSDLPFTASNGLGFFTSRATSEGERVTSAVSYRLDTSQSNGLWRAAQKFDWAGADSLPFKGTFPVMASVPESVGADIIAWDYFFVDRKTGAKSRLASDSSQFEAIVVTVAALDRTYRSILGSNGVEDLKTTRLAPPVEPGDVLAVWSANVTGAVGGGNLPQIPKNQIYLVQRTFFIP